MDKNERAETREQRRSAVQKALTTSDTAECADQIDKAVGLSKDAGDHR